MEKKKKLFISIPMNGKSEDEVLSERNRALVEAEKVLGEKVELIDTIYEDFDPSKSIPLQYLGRAIQDMAGADIAYFGTGWASARGCVIENQAAIKYGIKVIY